MCRSVGSQTRLEGLWAIKCVNHASGLSMTTIRAHIQTKCTTRGLGTKDMNHTRADKRKNYVTCCYVQNERGSVSRWFELLGSQLKARTNQPSSRDHSSIFFKFIFIDQVRSPVILSDNFKYRIYCKMAHLLFRIDWWRKVLRLLTY